MVVTLLKFILLSIGFGLVGCSKAVTKLEQLASVGGLSLAQTSVSPLQASGKWPVSGTCDSKFSEIQISIDESHWYSLKSLDASAISDCSSSHVFSGSVDPTTDPLKTELQKNPSGGNAYFVRGMSSFGSSSVTKVSVVAAVSTLPVISVADLSVLESAGNATINVSLSQASSQSVSLNYSTSDGTAASGSDYSFVAGVLTIPAGSTSGTITVPITADTIYEGSETFNLNLTSPVNATLANATAIITILDAQTMPTVSWNSASSANTFEGGTVSIGATLSGPSANTITVPIAFSGTATKNIDYIAASSLTFSPGATAATLTVSIALDGVREGSESFVATLGAPVGGASLGSPSSNSFTIKDEDGRYGWTGLAGDGRWTTPGNWYGGAVPATGNVAIFSSLYCSASCNAMLDAVVNVGGVFISDSYSGTISQSSYGITVGSSGWHQDTGSFVGSGPGIFVSGDFALGGGNFTSTAGVLTAFANVYILPGTFAHNLGTFTLYPSASVSFQVGNTSFNHLNLSTAGNGIVVELSTSNPSVLGSLGLAATATAGSTLNGGSILASGSVNVSSRGWSGTSLVKMVGASAAVLNGDLSFDARLPNVEIAKSGGTLSVTNRLWVTGDYKYTSGTMIVQSTSLLILNGGNSCSKNYDPGSSVSYYKVTLGGSNCTYSLLSDLVVADTLVIQATNSAINTGASARIKVNKYVNLYDEGISGTAKLLLGSTSEAVTLTSYSSSARVPKFEISSSYPVTLSGIGGGQLKFTSDFNYTSGAVTVSTLPVQFIEAASSSINLASDVNFENVSFLMTSGMASFSGGGALNSTNLYCGMTGGATIMGGIIKASLSVTGLACLGSPQFIFDNWGGNVTYSANSFFQGATSITIGTTLSLASAFSADSLNIYGVLQANSFNVSITNTLYVDNGATLDKGGCVLTTGATTGSGSIF